MNLFAVFPKTVSGLTETRFLLLGTLASSDGHGLFPRKRNAPAVIQFCGRSTDAAFQVWKTQAEDARNRYVNGELTYEELDILTQLPQKKGEK